MGDRAWHRSAAVGSGLFSAALVLLLADYLVSSRVLPKPEAEVEWVPAAERPYLRGDLGWYELKRSFQGRDYWGRLVFPVRTDELGFRRNDADVRKDGPARLIVLGDSFAFGMNGAWADTFVGMYDLAASGRVLNAAVPSYSPTPHLYRYQRALESGALSRPHTVVIALDISDVHDEAGVWVDADPHPANRRALQHDAGMVAEARAAFDATWRGRMRDRFRFSQSIYHYLRYSVLRIPNPAVFDQAKSRFTWDGWSDLDRTPGALAGFSPLGVQGGLDRIAAKVELMTALARTSGSRVYLLIYPWPAQVRYPDRFSWSAFAADVCARAACAGVIDTIPGFRAYARNHPGWYDELYVNGDVHFSIAGNRMVFEALASVLRP